MNFINEVYHTIAFPNGVWERGISQDKKNKGAVPEAGLPTSSLVVHLTV